MARDFDGVDDKIVIADNSDHDITGTALSLHAWINHDVTATRGGIVSKWGGTLPVAAYELEVTAGDKLSMSIADDAGTDTAAGATSISTGVWYSAGGRKSGTGAGALAVFLNGVSDGTATSNRSIHNGTGGLEIGRVINDTILFNGRIAEAAIWNVALTDAEFLALARGVPPNRIRRQSLKGYWPLHGISSPEVDLSGLAHPGTITGAIAANHSPTGPYVLL
jgi:hypothetical protein